MLVNGENLLIIKYDKASATEAVFNHIGMSLMNVTYDPLGRPLRWHPSEPFLPVTVTYDRFGQLEQWTWGDQRETYTHDKDGRLDSVSYADGTKITYDYKDDQRLTVRLAVYICIINTHLKNLTFASTIFICIHSYKRNITNHYKFATNT